MERGSKAQKFPRPEACRKNIPKCGEMWENGGKWVRMCRFWQTEWENGDKQAPKKVKNGGFLCYGTVGGGMLGDGWRKNGGKWG